MKSKKYALPEMELLIENFDFGFEVPKIFPSPPIGSAETLLYTGRLPSG